MKRALLVSFLLVAGCGLDLASNEKYCESDGDCAAGEECVPFGAGGPGGLCVPSQTGDGGMDGGPTDDAGACGASCYSGPDGTEDVGTCRAGTISCAGPAPVCRDEVTPASSDETCDLVDEDCDGAADEDAPPMSDCPIAQPGVCARGQLRCHMGGYACRPVEEASAERCDTLDNDCDAVVDEDTDFLCYPPEAPRGCVIDGSGAFICTGVCTAGRLSCDAGTSTCIGAREPDAGDGCTAAEPALDDDCDGTIDEDCADPCADDATRSCYTGSAAAAGRGICGLGTQTCSGGAWGACGGSTLPGTETCDNPGSDDDCNGVDDDIDGAGRACLDESAMGLCRTGAFTCEGSALTCVTPDPVAMEACDERDDDCDGSVDEAFDLLVDEENCGACGSACGPGRTCCGGTCADTTRDILHCGACDRGCGADEGCCGGDCMGLLDDPMNCGACGNVCAATQECCGGACIDPRSDEAHCGACGTPCSGSDQCCDGVCADAADPQCTGCATACGDETCCVPSCTDTDIDLANCGGCGVECTGDDDACCDGACTDIDLDEANCGECGAVCSGAADTCCEAGCVDTDTDLLHCGGCGIACDPGELCCGGSCIDPDSTAAHCGDCTTNCAAAGQLCSDGNCCPPGDTWCDAVSDCVDLTDDEAHCGSCGNACGAGQLCCGGSCVNPTIDEANCGACGTTCSGAAGTCCASSCVNVIDDESHCGMCGRACLLTNCVNRNCL